MGLFREFGRQVEQVKRSVTGDDDTEAGDDAAADDGAEASDGDADYECESCGARFDTHDGECPECWSTEITSSAE